MSAWIVTKHHIDLLVSASINYGIAIKLDAAGAPETATTAMAEELGRILWAENIRSVAYRYNLDGNEEHAQYLRNLADYRFCHYPGIRAAAVAQALACYDYQACECPDYPQSAARFFVCALENAVGEPDGMDAQPWGFDTAETVMNAIGKEGG